MFLNSNKSLVFPINALPACRLVAEGIDTLSHSFEIKQKAVHKYYRLVDADILFCFSDIVIQAEAMGARVRFAPDAMPAIEHPASTILHPRAQQVKRMAVNAGVIQSLAREFPQKTIAGMVYGPFTVAGQLAGEQNVMKGLRENKRQVLELIEHCFDFALDYGSFLFDSGANLLWVSDPLASLLSPIDFERFVQGFLSRLFKAFPKNSTALHICGDTTQLVNAMVQTGVSGISFDQCMNLTTIEDMIPEQVEIIGNADPDRGVATATFPEIDTMVFDLASQMGTLPNFSLSTGCALPFSTPIENVTRFVDVAKNQLEKIQKEKVLLKSLGQAVFSGNQDETTRFTQMLLLKKVDLQIIIDAALMRAVRKGSALYESGRFYLPDLLLLTDSFYCGFEIVRDGLLATNRSPQVILGVVKGDFHEIGKDIVKAMLEANGIHVIDLGVDVTAEAFISCARKHKVSILGLSAFTTSSRKELKKIVGLVKTQDSPITAVLAGGAALSESTAQKLGIDGYAKDAVSAVALVKHFLIKKMKPHVI
ncbi:MAG: uroporphyrinogen decarboxylase family protein [Pseudomonadota bacterium]